MNNKVWALALGSLMISFNTFSYEDISLELRNIDLTELPQDFQVVVTNTMAPGQKKEVRGGNILPVNWYLPQSWIGTNYILIEFKYKPLNSNVDQTVATYYAQRAMESSKTPVQAYIRKSLTSTEHLPVPNTEKHISLKATPILLTIETAK